MTVEQRIDEQNDQFPAGMRVLAVDDDPTCLKLLETLLRKCQYHVTTTSQAISALKLLRENKSQFDLVISDVRMPDMDGFKLLELVGLEMDLPVIMLSSYGDTKLVMKGITHGACDYLLKPVRIEELKNIWQHVVRRKKFDPKDHKNFEKPIGEAGDGGEGFAGMGDSDQNGKLNRKRKDQDNDEDDEREENGLNNEDPSTQKKPRVVWSVELHRKFVAAVYQLGIDKAVPKKILELMNEEKLSRENVASHLQKFRLYLKRINCVASQQANMVAALGGADSSYLQMGSLNGIGNLHSVSGSGQLQNAAFRSVSPGSVLGRLNSAAGLGMRGLPSTRMGHLGFAQNLSNAYDDLTSLHPIMQPMNPNGNILSGIPISLQTDQLQSHKGLCHIGGLGSSNDSVSYPISSGFSDTKINGGSSSNSLFDVTNEPTMFEGPLLDGRRSRVLRDQFSITDPPNSKFASHLPDFGRCNDNWANAVQPYGVQSDSFTLSDCFKQSDPSDLRDNISSMATRMVINSHDVSSANLVPNCLPDTRSELHCQVAPVSSDAGQIVSFIQRQGWNYQRDDTSRDSDQMCSSIKSSIRQRVNPSSTFCHKNDDLSLIGESHCVDPTPMQHDQLKGGYLDEQPKPQGIYAHSNSGSLEDVVSLMMKQEQDKLMLKEGNVRCNPFNSVGGCK